MRCKCGHPKPRRSWVWRHFDHVTKKTAKCRFCKRLINCIDNHWAWKVFDVIDTIPTCSICNYQTAKDDDQEQNLQNVLDHLMEEHGVVSGSQIISTDTLDVGEI
ncbi:unnamed protein product [Leptidea sinapis]|uniref:BED-type domain-containing protein n=1 Tax=Leptidea sinapis TaxID=189913 RepID=A0A5E4PX66_9NEOP|nr:unnamed protein product [Leptidea sinapis]